jgi:hypothetical protein
MQVDLEREKGEIRRQATGLIEQLLDRMPLSLSQPLANADGATEALVLAGQLFRLVAGWAVWQELAAAARRAGVELGPTRLWVPSARERLLPSDGKVILHQLDAILRIFQGCFELSGCEVIRDQIGALLAGDDSIVFRPQKSGRHGKEGYRLWVLRARAVAHVEYLVACKTPITKARKRVADAYGEAAGKNIEMWGRRAPEILGPELFDELLEWARQEARQSVEMRAFGDARLQDDGKNYRRLKKGEEPLGPDKARRTVLVLRDPERPGVYLETGGLQMTRKRRKAPDPLGGTKNPRICS